VTTHLLRAQLKAALEKLRSELQIASFGKEDPPLTARDRAAYALTHINDFLHTLGWSDVSLPLIALNGALYDLDNGTIAPILAAPKFQNRHQDSTTRRRFKGLCAASVVLLQRNCNMTVDAAAKHVAGIVQGSGFRIGGCDPGEGWKTIKSWRYDVTSSRRNPAPETLEQFLLIQSDPRWPAAGDGPHRALSFVRIGLLRALNGIGIDNVN
jgi:hypothetical protein